MDPRPAARYHDTAGSSLIDLRRIFCLTRNYSSHAREMGAAPSAPPAIFIKPDTSFLSLSTNDESLIPYPAYGEDLHHEAELVILCLDPVGERYAYGVGLDLTLRDIQAGLKEKSLPWTIAKGFNAAAPTGEFWSSRLIGDDLQTLSFSLEVNDVLKQKGQAADMTLPLSEIPAYVGRYFNLLPGDLIFTGTPEGVGRLSGGDILKLDLMNGQSLLAGYRARIHPPDRTPS